MQLYVLALTLAAACVPLREPSYYSINADGSKSEVYSRLNEWSSYGTHGLGAQATVAEAYAQAQHAPPPVNRLEVYNASLPPGVTLDNGTIKIADGAPYQAIGRFEIGYWQSSAPRERAIEPDLHRLAHVTGGDTITVDVQHFDHADDRVQYVTGVVLRKRTQVATHREHARARLVYKTTAGCPGEEDLPDEVSAKLGYSPWKATAAPVQAEIARGGGGYVATVSRAGASAKSLHGASCKDVIDAVVTALVVELDDLASAY
jgi:hypothetical protein